MKRLLAVNLSMILILALGLISCDQNKKLTGPTELTRLSASKAVSQQSVQRTTRTNSEDQEGLGSYITVVVAEDGSDPNNVGTSFTITWSDADDCSTNYNAYIYRGQENRTLLGSVASDGTQITESSRSVGSHVELYCGTYDPESRQNLVSSVEILWGFRGPLPGTYSSAPLISLTVSPGTLTPTFSRDMSIYTVPDVPNANDRITIHTTAMTVYNNVTFVKNPSWGVIRICSGGVVYACTYSYGSNEVLLTDAAPNTPGFQVDLDEGENELGIHIYRESRPDHLLGSLYRLNVTRAAADPSSSPSAFWSATLTVGEASDSSGMLGYTVFVDLPGGAISSQSFDDYTNTVQLVIYGPTGLYLGVFSELTTSFALQIGTARFESSDASSRQGDNSYIYHWDDAELSWTAGDSVSVALIQVEESETQTTAEVAENLNSPATGQPSISGTAQVDQTLTASTSGIADTDGLSSASFSYQWISNDGTDDSDISGATNSTYTLVEADEGKTIKVRVSFTDDAGHAETLTSEPTEEVAAVEPLTAAFENTHTPDSHNGTDAFKFRVVFSEAVGTSYVTLRDHSFDVTNGTVTRARRVDGRSDLWEITVDPASNADVTVVLPATDDCDAQDAVCTSDDKPLSNRVEITVSGPTPTDASLTATFQDAPDSHNGTDAFKFRVVFSEAVGTSYKTLRDHSFDVTNGTVTGARRVDGRSDLWEITVEPASDADVTIVLPATDDCDAQDAVCTNDDKPLSNRVEITVPGPGD